MQSAVLQQYRVHTLGVCQQVPPFSQLVDPPGVHGAPMGIVFFTDPDAG